LPIELQELARISGAGIGNDKADIQILRIFGEPENEALCREVQREGPVLNMEIV
jgi:hypothetical protein